MDSPASVGEHRRVKRPSADRDGDQRRLRRCFGDSVGRKSEANLRPLGFGCTASSVSIAASIAQSQMSPSDVGLLLEFAP